MQGELGGAGLDRLQDQVAVKAHPLRAGPHIGAGLFQDLACLDVHEIHAHLFQNGQRGVMDRLQFVF